MSSDLGLDKAGVELTPHYGREGRCLFADRTCASIYAVGDVTNRVNLTPVAIREGHAFADTVFGGKDVKVDHSPHPDGCLLAAGDRHRRPDRSRRPARASSTVDIYKTSFRPMKHTLSGRDERMLMKLVVDGETDRVLGCHICGPDAGEMAQLLGIAVRLGAKKSDFDATMAVHPTAAEELVTMREKWVAGK